MQITLCNLKYRNSLTSVITNMGFPGSSAGKESACNAGDLSSIVGKIPWRRDRLPTPVFLGFPGGSAGKESACNAGDLGSIPQLGRSPGGGLGKPLQYSCLENPHGPGRVQSMGSQRGGPNRVTKRSTALLIYFPLFCCSVAKNGPTLCDPIRQSLYLLLILL